jgi:hypothetical protein
VTGSPRCRKGTHGQGYSSPSLTNRLRLSAAPWPLMPARILPARSNGTSGTKRWQVHVVRLVKELVMQARTATWQLLRHSRAGPDRLREDARVLHPARGQAGRGVHDGVPPTRPGAGAHPRAGHSGPGGHLAAGARHVTKRRRHLRWHPAEPVGGCPAQPQGHRRRLPGASARSHRAGPLAPR